MIVTMIMKRLAGAALNTCIALKLKYHKPRKECIDIFYGEAVNKFLDRYTMEDFIANTYDDMMSFTKSSDKLSTEQAEALCNKVLCCKVVLD